MSNLDKIKNKIIDKANKEVEKIEDDFKKKTSSIISRRKNEALRDGANLVDRIKRESENDKDRTISINELKKRDKILFAKQELLDKCFHEAKKEFLDLDDERYISFVKKTLVSFSPDEAILIVPNNRIKNLKKESLGFEIKKGDINSGFLVKKGGVIFNFSFDDLVDFNRESLEGDVLKTLFESGN